jgi:DNA-binding MarR family transcriptional regulator
MHSPETNIDDVADLKACACAASEVFSDDDVPRLPADEQAAWVGFLAAHSEILRALDAGLISEFGLSLSALEVLARIARASEGGLRMSELAQSALLSPSRVSRIVDLLQERHLVQRSTCPSDSRGVFALITPDGHELTSRALQWHWGQVRERFFQQLSEQQIKELGTIWQSVLGRAVSSDGACPD